MAIDLQLETTLLTLAQPHGQPRPYYSAFGRNGLHPRQRGIEQGFVCG